MQTLRSTISRALPSRSFSSATARFHRATFPSDTRGTEAYTSGDVLDLEELDHALSAEYDKITKNHSDFEAVLSGADEPVTLRPPKEYAPLALGGGSSALTDRANLDRLSGIAAQQWSTTTGQPMSKSQARSIILGGLPCPEHAKEQAEMHMCRTEMRPLPSGMNEVGLDGMDKLYYAMATNNIRDTEDAAYELDYPAGLEYSHIIHCQAPSCRSKTEHLGALMFKDDPSLQPGCVDLHTNTSGHTSSRAVSCDDPSHRPRSDLSVIGTCQRQLSRPHDLRAYTQEDTSLLANSSDPWTFVESRTPAERLNDENGTAATIVSKMHVAARAIEERAKELHHRQASGVAEEEDDCDGQ
ncbi:hypothetical protein IAT40_001295 [Kwoniella sp. CBS 6097]